MLSGHGSWAYVGFTVLVVEQQSSADADAETETVVRARYIAAGVYDRRTWWLAGRVQSTHRRARAGPVWIG